MIYYNGGAMKKIEQFSDLTGETLKSVKGEAGDDEIIFELEDGRKFRLYHERDCCESVYVESVIGNLSDLVGTPLLMADEVCGAELDDREGKLNECDESYTWTFYKLATVKGYVDIRFYGTSNGYYSESVSFVKAY